MKKEDIELEQALTELYINISGTLDQAWIWKKVKDKNWNYWNPLALLLLWLSVSFITKKINKWKNVKKYL